MGSIQVSEREGVIHAKYEGRMTSDLVQQAAEEIRAMLNTGSSALIVYDTSEMEEPQMELAQWMKGFDAEISDRVRKTATVIPDYLVKAKVGVAFVYSKEHEIFYDLDQAIRWLKG